MKGKESWSIDALVGMVYQHLATSIERVDNDGAHVPKPDLKDWPFKFSRPFLTYRCVILQLVYCVQASVYFSKLKEMSKTKVNPIVVGGRTSATLRGSQECL